MWKRKSCFVWKARFSGRRVWKQVKVIKIPMSKADLLLKIWLRSNNFEVKPVNTASLYADREGRKSFKQHETWFEFFKSNLIACCLHSLRSLIGIFSRYLFVWQLATTHARVREARNSRQNDVTGSDFSLQGKQVVLSLSRWLLRKHNLRRWLSWLSIGLQRGKSWVRLRADQHSGS